MSKKRLMTTVAAAALLLLQATGPVTAAEVGLPAMTPAQEEQPVTETQVEISVEGVLEYEGQLESPHYVVNGWALKLDEGMDLSAMAGKRVVVKGEEFTGMSILMRRQLVVKQVQLAKPVELNHVPEAVRVAGLSLKLPVAPVLKDGHLMLPLRAVVEASGGQVRWDPVQWAVEVTMPAKSALVQIGQAEATRVERPAPYLQDGYTLVAAAFLEELGLRLDWEGAVLHVNRPETTTKAGQ